MLPIVGIVGYSSIICKQLLQSNKKLQAITSKASGIIYIALGLKVLSAKLESA